MSDLTAVDHRAAASGMPSHFQCRVCKALVPRDLVLRSQRHDIDVPVYWCASCDAHSSLGGPVSYDDTDLASYYLPHAAAIHRRYESLFEHIEATRKPGRFLDIGAGIGFSLDVALRRGWAAEGIEPNRALAHHARDRGLVVDHGYLDGSRTGQYEFVLIDNVLEHVPDPVGFLRDAARLLAPGALMVVAVPPVDWLRKALGKSDHVRRNVSRPQFNIFIEVDEHLTMFTRRAMTRAVGLSGLHLRPDRFHHSKSYDNVLVRVLGLDDGYYFIEKGDA